MDTFQFEGRVYEMRLQPTGSCTGCAFLYRSCMTGGLADRPSCGTSKIFVEVRQPASAPRPEIETLLTEQEAIERHQASAQRGAAAQQPAASGLTRLVPLRQKALHTLEETTISDPQVAFWGVSITGVPMVRLATLADAQLVQRLADAAFQAGRQKAFSDLADWVSARP